MYARHIKRAMDIGFATIVLIISLPANIVIAIVIKLSSSGPVLFTQQRTGLNGHNFTMYKFRTMVQDNNVLDTTCTNKTTKAGKVIRALSLDELPQFINVLLGDMSVIGPRPWLPEYYQHMDDLQRQRADVLPGITGLAQASGRNSLTIMDKIQYDITYVHNVSLVLDAQIALMTAIECVKRSGQEIEKHAIHHEIKTLKVQRASQSNETPAFIQGQLALKGGSVFYSKIPTDSKPKKQIKKNVK